jgi:hypothetical protein
VGLSLGLRRLPHQHHVSNKGLGGGERVQASAGDRAKALPKLDGRRHEQIRRQQTRESVGDGHDVGGLDQPQDVLARTQHHSREALVFQEQESGLEVGDDKVLVVCGVLTHQHLKRGRFLS